MKLLCLLLLSLSSLICQETDGSTPTEIVYTGSGPVRGREVIKDGKTQYEFLGVPFAQPPVGPLRFMPPQPVKPWVEVMEAVKDGATCIQAVSELSEEFASETGTNAEESEDCLTLNIFTNSLGSRKAPQAVMVWIYGGGFTLGSKDIYRMSALVAEDVVLVAMNYRLGALGFLSFGNDLVSGNMGLRDQHLALMWVQANIQEFGGDPTKITIFGESAGAVSVQAQVLSPLNSGVIQGAIAQSGSVLFLNLDKPGEEKIFARNAAKALGCPQSLDSRTLECLQKVDFKQEVSKVTDSPSAFFDPSYVVKFKFVPVVDSYASQPFIPTDPLEAFKTGMFNKIPFMSGTCAFEGVLMTGALSLQGIEGAGVVDLIELPPKTSWTIHYGQDDVFNKVATKFYNHSTGDSRIELEKPALDFFTDSMFLSSDQKAVELMSEHTRHIYNYYFSQETNQSLMTSELGLPSTHTPGHGDDLTFQITEGAVDPSKFSEAETATAGHMTRYWTNFAKFGNPTPVTGEKNSQLWYPVTPDAKNYMEIKATPEMKKDLHSERMFFWDRMVWAERESMVEKNQLHVKATNFLLNP